MHLKRALPDVIISDLNMPQRSGFEFLSVARRRFPEILVIAMSGAYQEGSAVPGGVIADGFYPQGEPSRSSFQYRGRPDQDRCDAAGGPSQGIRAGVDSTKWQGRKRSALHRADL